MNNNRLAWILLLVLSGIWGCSFILIKRALVVFTPEEAATLRIAASSIFLFLVGFHKLKKIKLSQAHFYIFAGLCGNLVPAFLFSFAQTRLDSSVAGILNALSPLFSLLVGRIFFKQMLLRMQVSGILLSFGGATCLSIAASGGLGSFNVYALLIVLATFLYGTNINFIKFKIQNEDPVLTSVASLLLVSPIAWVYLGFSGFWQKAATAPLFWQALGAVSILGILGSGLALILFNVLLKITNPVFASLVTYIMPLVAIAIGLYDGESFGWQHFISVLLIAAGVYCVKISTPTLGQPSVANEDKK